MIILLLLFGIFLLHTEVFNFKNTSSDTSFTVWKVILSKLNQHCTKAAQCCQHKGTSRKALYADLLSSLY